MGTMPARTRAHWSEMRAMRSDGRSSPTAGDYLGGHLNAANTALEPVTVTESAVPNVTVILAQAAPFGPPIFEVSSHELSGALRLPTNVILKTVTNGSPAIAPGGTVDVSPDEQRFAVTLRDANVDGVPAPTAAKLGAARYQRRFVFGGTAVVNDPTYAALGADERVAGADRDATSAAAATRFFPKASTAWVADGGDFVGGITGGAMAAKLGGPLLLATGRISLSSPSASWTVIARLAG